MQSIENITTSQTRNSLHHLPLQWPETKGNPVYSLAGVTREKREEWCHFFDVHRMDRIGPFCGPDVWIPWFFANPHRAPLIFEKRDAAGFLEALLPLCRDGKHLSLPCESEFSYGDLVAISIEAGVDLLQDVLEYCEQGRINLRLGKVMEGSQLHVSLQHPDIFLRSATVERPVTSVRRDCYPKTFPGKITLKKTYPLTKSHGDIRHFTGQNITGSLLCEINDTIGPGIVNFDHFLSLQTRNTEKISISTHRAETGGDLDSCLIGYFENDSYHIITNLGNSLGCGLVNASILYFYLQSTGTSFSVFHSLETDRGTAQPVSCFTIFPRKTSSFAKIAGHRIFSRIQRFQ